MSGTTKLSSLPAAASNATSTSLVTVQSVAGVFADGLISPGALPVQPTGALVYRTASSLFGDSINVKDFGAIGDGNSHELQNVTAFNGQNTTGWTLAQWQAYFPAATTLTNQLDAQAFIAAIAYLSLGANNSWGGGVLHVQPGNYQIDVPISISVSFITIAGPVTQGAILTLSGSGGIVVSGTSTTQIRNVNLRNLGIFNGGTQVSFQWVYFCVLSGMQMDGGTIGLNIGQGCNTVFVNDTVIANQSQIGLWWNAPASDTGRSDVLAFNNVIISGAFVTGSVGLLWQGMCNTMVGTGLRILHFDIGIRIINPTTSTSNYPGFMNLHDVELEGFLTRALSIEAGAEFKLCDSDINNLTGGTGQGSADDYAIYVLPDASGSNTHTLQLVNCRVGDCQKSAVYFAAANLQMVNTTIFSSSMAGSGTNPAILLAATASGAQISNTVVDEPEGTANVNYGVQALAGATAVQITNLNAALATVAAIDNLTAAGELVSYSVIGPNSTAVVAVTAGASPFAYTIPARGAVAISGGTVSAISITRNSVVVPTGVIAGLISGMAGDVVTVTYSAVPTINFIPE